MRNARAEHSIRSIRKDNTMRSTNSIKSKRKGPLAKDSNKESLFRGLVKIFEASGVTVRREKLKAGPGWKVISGTCRAEDKKYIFVDPRLTQDDQILFLRSRAELFGVVLPETLGEGVAVQPPQDVAAEIATAA